MNRPLPCVSYQSFKIFEFSASEFGAASMRRLHACAYEFLSTVREGAVLGVHTVVIQSSVSELRYWSFSCVFDNGELRVMEVVSQ